MQTLKGLHVLNTRPEEQGLDLQTQLVTLGADTVLCPMLQIAPLASAGYASALLKIKPDIMIATSVNAVKSVGNYIARHHKAWLTTVPVIALGPATASALHLQGWRNVTYPTVANSEGVLAMRALAHVRAKTVVIMTGMLGRNLLEPALHDRGAKVVRIEGYERQAVHALSASAKDLLAKEPVVVVLTSTEAWHTLLRLLSTLDEAILSRTIFIAASIRIAEVMRQTLTKQTILVAKQTSNEAIIEAICTWFKETYHE